MALRVGVAGALGRLGRVACQAVAEAEGLELVAAFARTGGVALRQAQDDRGRVVTEAELGPFLRRSLDVVVDCTVYPTTVEVARAAIEAGASPVIGATGWTGPDVALLAERCNESGVPAMLIPNFSFGAVLMMRFAAQAARVFPRAEIIELHHDAKRDAPSGTARLTAQRIVEAGAPEPPIHSVRLPGLLAHQETIFGGRGETLTIRHDSLARDSFGPGIVAAVKTVRGQRGLVVGLDAVVEEMLA